jgi:transcriptional regulator with XRE-family HTH domain
MKPLEAFSPVQQRFRRHVAKELRRFLTEVESSPTGLARRTGKSREYSSRILSGRFVPSWQFLAELVHSYGYTAEVRIRKGIHGKTNHRRAEHNH